MMNRLRLQSVIVAAIGVSLANPLLAGRNDSGLADRIEVAPESRIEAVSTSGEGLRHHATERDDG